MGTSSQKPEVLVHNQKCHILTYQIFNIRYQLSRGTVLWSASYVECYIFTPQFVVVVLAAVECLYYVGFLSDLGILSLGR